MKSLRICGRRSKVTQKQAMGEEERRERALPPKMASSPRRNSAFSESTLNFNTKQLIEIEFPFLPQSFSLLGSYSSLLIPTPSVLRKRPHRQMKKPWPPLVSPVPHLWGRGSLQARAGLKCGGQAAWAEGLSSFPGVPSHTQAPETRGPL